MRRDPRVNPVPRGVAVILLATTQAISAEPQGGVKPSPAERPAAVADDVVVEPAPAEQSAEAAAAQLRLGYAVARLRLAELDLERAVVANHAAKGAVGNREIDRLKNHVALVRHQLEIARGQPRTASRQATMAAAHVARDNARADLDSALKANQLAPGAVSDLNLERLRARLELAEIRVALCQNSASGLSLLDEMQWNIDQLTDEVIDLRHRVETRGGGDFGKPN